MIAEHRKSLGITPRKISDEEIVQRLVFSLVNEAAHILEEGIANKASDIDVVYIFGYGFPVHRGGPLKYADEVGLFNVVQAMKRFQQNPLDDAKFWEPAPLLARLVAEGKLRWDSRPLAYIPSLRFAEATAASTSAPPPRS